jgi:hypothetical protein
MPVTDFFHDTSDMCYNVNSVYINYMAGNYTIFDNTLMAHI